MGSSRKRFGRRIDCVGSEGGGIHQLATGYSRHRRRRARIDAHGARPAETPMEFWKSSCSSSIRKACSFTWRSAMIRFLRSRRPSCQHPLIYSRPASPRRRTKTEAAVTGMSTLFFIC